MNEKEQDEEKTYTCPSLLLQISLACFNTNIILFPNIKDDET